MYMIKRKLVYNRSILNISSDYQCTDNDNDNFYCRPIL